MGTVQKLVQISAFGCNKKIFWGENWSLLCLAWFLYINVDIPQSGRSCCLHLRPANDGWWCSISWCLWRINEKHNHVSHLWSLWFLEVERGLWYNKIQNSFWQWFNCGLFCFRLEFNNWLLNWNTNLIRGISMMEQLQTNQLRY